MDNYWLNAEGCTIEIKDRSGQILFKATLEAASTIAWFNESGILIPFFYRMSLYDDYGNYEGTSNILVKQALKITDYKG